GLYVFTAAAMWTSIGLGISIWIRRLGRAVAVATALYTLVVVAWPVLMTSLFPTFGIRPAMMSPLYACFYLVISTYERNVFEDTFIWMLCWIAGQSVVALGLLLAELLTFDRCLGRVGG